MGWIIAAAAVFVLLIIYFTAVFLLFKKSVGRCDKFVDLSDDTQIAPYKFGENIIGIRRGVKFVIDSKPEEIYIKSFDGLRLFARLVKAEIPTGTIIMFHGYRSYIEFDFASVIEKYHNMGYNLLLVTQRSHGKSEGKYISLGVFERCDCVSWAEYTNERFGNDMPIILEGLSMGAATVLMASDLPLPENVRAVIADCGFTSPEEIVRHVTRDIMHIPGFLIMPTLRLYYKLFIHCKMTDASSVEALKKTKLPVLLIHGDADNFVPYRMSVENDKACASPHVFITVAGAEHGRSYLVDRVKCDKALEEFLGKYAK